MDYKLALDGSLSIGEIIGLGIIVIGVVTGIGIFLSQSRQKGENEITRAVREEARKNDKDPCDILDGLLQACTDNATKRKIQQAQKFLGCRNRRKRRR